MKRVIKQCLFAALLALARVGEAVVRPRYVAALMYHSIGSGDWELAISSDVFERQIRYLQRRGYVFLTLEQARDFVRGTFTGFRRGVLVTFDDGYKDFLTVALPILQKYRIPAVVFVHTDRSERELGTNTPLMAWPDILQAARADIAIESHSHAHPNLKTLAPGELEHDLRMAHTVFLENLGRSPRAFAYPGGKFNDEVICALKADGYDLAFTIDAGLIRAGDDAFRLKRIGVTRRTSQTEFAARTSWAGQWYATLVHLV